MEGMLCLSAIVNRVSVSFSSVSPWWWLGISLSSEGLKFVLMRELFLKSYTIRDNFFLGYTVGAKRLNKFIVLRVELDRYLILH